jgi:hypothetical protein
MRRERRGSGGAAHQSLQLFTNEDEAVGGEHELGVELLYTFMEVEASSSR